MPGPLSSLAAAASQLPHTPTAGTAATIAAADAPGAAAPSLDAAVAAPARLRVRARAAALLLLLLQVRGARSTKRQLSDVACQRHVVRLQIGSAASHDLPLRVILIAQCTMVMRWRPVVRYTLLTTHGPGPTRARNAHENRACPLCVCVFKAPRSVPDSRSRPARIALPLATPHSPARAARDSSEPTERIHAIHGSSYCSAVQHAPSHKCTWCARASTDPATPRSAASAAG